VIFLLILLLLYAVYPLYLLVGIKKLIYNKNRSMSLAPVSVIVSAKNEEHHISSCLDALIKQSYPKDHYEIIVIDDASTDQTASIIQKYAGKYSFIKLLRSHDKGFKSSKKSALFAGVREASGEYLFFTDADCQPPENWLKSMFCYFDEHTGLVAGFSPQTSHSSLWSNVLFADSLAAACVAAGSIGWQHGVTCTGRNVAVRRTALNDIGVYENFPDSLSGDDDFLLQLIAKHPDWKVNYSTLPESVVPASGPSNVQSFMRQKQRHFSAGHYFSCNVKCAYGIYHTVNVLIWLLALGGIFFSWIFMLPLVLKLVIDFFLLKYWSHVLKIPLKPFAFLLWNALFLMTILIAASGSFRDTLKWTSGR